MGSLVHRSDTEQDALRRELIKAFRASPIYTNHVAATLRPVWRDVKRRYGWEATTVIYEVAALADDQRWESENGGPPADAELAAYVETVRETVARHMRLTIDGGPAPWALQFVHADAAEEHGWPRDLPHAFFSKWQQITVEMHVSELDARVIVTRHHDDPKQRITIHPSSGVFREWDDLRLQIHGLIDDELNRVQADFERSYEANAGPYKKRYSGAFCGVGEDVKLLHAFLTATPRHPVPIDRATRERLRRLTKAIGVELPPKNRTKARRE